MKPTAPAYGSNPVDVEQPTLPSDIHDVPDKASPTTKNRIATTLAVFGYASTSLGGPNGDATFVPTVQFESVAHAAVASSQFVAPHDDSLYPTLDELDVSPKDGVVTQKEYLMNLEVNKDADIAKINASSLPDDIKAQLITQVDANFELDGPCVVRAMKRIKASRVTLTRANIKVFYYSLTTFCPTTAVESVQAALARYTTKQVVVETPDGKTVRLDIPLSTPAPVLPTSASSNSTVNDSGDSSPTISTTTDSSLLPGSSKYDTDVTTTAVPTTSIVVDTPSGPTKIMLPVVQDGEPSTAVVVDTPSGPTVLEVPLTNAPSDSRDVATITDHQTLERYSEQELEDDMMAFYDAVLMDFESSAANAEAEETLVTTRNMALDDCIVQASNKFGWDGVYEEPQYLEKAVDWVDHTCLFKAIGTYL